MPVMYLFITGKCKTLSGGYGDYRDKGFVSDVLSF